MKKCPGSFRGHAQFFLVIVMSNQGTDCFLALLIIAADGFETTEQQEELISFLKDRKAINMIAPGTAGFDLDEMPWQDDEVNKEIVIPWLKQFAELIRQMTSAPLFTPT